MDSQLVHRVNAERLGEGTRDWGLRWPFPASALGNVVSGMKGLFYFLF